MSGPFKMKGSENLGYGNQHSSSRGMPFASPAKDTPHTTTEDHAAHKVKKKKSGYNPVTATPVQEVVEGFKTMGRTLAEPVVKVYKGAKNLYDKATN